MHQNATFRWQLDKRSDTVPFAFAQPDGSAPDTGISIDAPGERGFGISRHAFSGGARISAVPTDNLIVIQTNRVGRMRCRIADEKLEHRSQSWNVTICPAGASAEADCDEDVEIVILSVPVETIGFAASQTTHGSHVLDPRLEGLDPPLTAFVRNVLCHAPPGIAADPLWWDQATDLLVDHLISNYASVSKGRSRKLSVEQVHAVQGYIRANACEPLTVDMLAKTVGHSRAHFTRAFTQATGLTPHYYVMRTRLSHAYDLMRQENCGPAAAAAGAGFTDQSHLAAWTRRVFGTTTGRMRRATRRPSSDGPSTDVQERPAA
jgi:AraC family transcriptional regulator